MIAVANFIGLPLLFLSSTLISIKQIPSWMQTAARYNPVNWGVEAARNAVVVGGEWWTSGQFLLFLVAAAAVTTGFATWSFRAYQRSI